MISVLPQFLVYSTLHVRINTSTFEEQADHRIDQHDLPKHIQFEAWGNNFTVRMIWAFFPAQDGEHAFTVQYSTYLPISTNHRRSFGFSWRKARQHVLLLYKIVLCKKFIVNIAQPASPAILRMGKSILLAPKLFELHPVSVF